MDINKDKSIFQFLLEELGEKDKFNLFLFIKFSFSGIYPLSLSILSFVFTHTHMHTCETIKLTWNIDVKLYLFYRAKDNE